MGPKMLNFQSFDLYKGKIISHCSLELEHSKNIYFSHVISIYLEDIGVCALGRRPSKSTSH